MAQGLKRALEKELQEYYRLLAIVQSQMQQTTVDTPMSEERAKTGDEMTMLKLNVWMLECRPRLQVLAEMLDSCEGMKGGQMCSVIYNYSLHGDPMTCSVTNSLLSTVAKPLYLMLCQWILYGELEDPFSEFFIASDPYCKKEQLWHSKYTIR
jgi:gamma-tubulin complex component 3